jgi:hypothetical protein
MQILFNRPCHLFGDIIMRTRTVLTATSVLASCLLLGGLAAPVAADTPAPVSDDEAGEIAVEAYIYGYPLVLMEVTRRVTSNVETPAGAHGPMNQFEHLRAFPDAAFTDVVRPNADTLYSSLWFDVSKEPLVISVPDSGGRYYLLPMLGLWTDVFASPGKRTTGTGAQTFAIVGPKWDDKLPDGVKLIRAPTSMGWMIGRTQTNGKADFGAVHKFQGGLTAVPLSGYGKPYLPPQGKLNPKQDMGAPVEQVAKMDAATFFTLFADVTRDNAPHANDYPVLARIKRIGLEPGRPFDLAQASPQARQALEKAPAAAQKLILSQLKRLGTKVGNWLMITPPVGTYGTDYVRRAVIAYGGLGANVSEDAVYPTTMTDADGEPYDSNKKYIVQFSREQLPPVRAFWSLTMYNDKQFFTANPIDRFAIGDRDKLKFNEDGSLALYIQRDSPGKELEANWLPAPKEGGFTMNLRLYWPKPAALDGSWMPPTVKEAK